MGLLAKLRRAMRSVTIRENSGCKESKKASRKKGEVLNRIRSSSGKEKVGSRDSQKDNGLFAESGDSPTNACVSTDTVEAFFAKYRDPSEDCILAEGMERLCADMYVDPTDVRMLALAWKFGAVTMCRFEREAFVNGCLALSVGCAESLQLALDSVLEEGAQSYHDLYKFTFNFGLDTGERCASRDIAIALWKLVLPVCGERANAFTEQWCGFLEKKNVRGVTRDCWMVYLEFCQVMDEDFANYSSDDAWPSLLDEFVEDQLRKRQLSSNKEAQGRRNIL